MTSPIGGISFPVMPVAGVGAATGVAGLAGVAGAAAAEAPAGVQPAGGFAEVLASSFDRLQSTQSVADGFAAQVATGDLRDVHDYMIASNEAKLATEMVVTIKNKAVEAFSEIMRMPI